jgi:hypothetical protein
LSGLGGIIQRLVGALEGAGVRYMFVGSIASTHHGAPRTTQDVDLVVELTGATLGRGSALNRRALE